MPSRQSDSDSSSRHRHRRDLHRLRAGRRGRGPVTTAKVPVDAGRPGRGDRRRAGAARGADRVERLVIGTTVATNAVLERRGPRGHLHHQRGFEDVPFIGRMDKERIYDLHWQKPEAAGAAGATASASAAASTPMAARSSPLEASDLGADARQAAARYAGEDVAVAICCLFAYLDGDHEAGTAGAVRDVAARAPTSPSRTRSRRCGASTSARARPSPTPSSSRSSSRYVERVGGVIAATLGARRWNLLASNGGYLTRRPGAARARPSSCSPASPAASSARATSPSSPGTRAPSSLDMGGTSSRHRPDRSTAASNTPPSSSSPSASRSPSPASPSRRSARAAARSPGSTSGGLLHVGPAERRRRAGPGRLRPRRRRSRRSPTPTSCSAASIPTYFLGGAHAARPRGRARGASRRLGERLGADAPRKPRSPSCTIADENMANAIRLIAVERGLDPRDFALIAFGGAGPLHARAVAERLGMTTVSSRRIRASARPSARRSPRPGSTACRPSHADSDDVDLAALLEPRAAAARGAVAELRAQRRRSASRCPQLGATCATPARTTSSRCALPDGGLDAGGWQALLERFAERPRAPVRLRAPGRAGRADQPARRRRCGPSRRPDRRRPAARRRPGRERGAGLVRPARPVDCADLPPRRASRPGAVIAGPAIIEETDSTTLVFPGDRFALRRERRAGHRRWEALHERPDARRSTPSGCTSSTTRSPTSPPRWRS